MRRHGDLEAVEDFIAVGKDVNETDAEKRSPLHYAVAYSHPEIVSELLSNGADVSAVVCTSSWWKTCHLEWCA